MVIEALGVACGPGNKATGWYKVGELASGSDIHIPVRIVNGAKEGKRFGIIAAVHGDETNGIEAVNRFLDELDPAQMSGSVVAVPMANPLAFMAKARMTPLDYERSNMNRVFPGDVGNLITQRIAAALFEGVVIGSDAFMDMHEGGYAFMARYVIVPEIADNPKLSATTLALAEAFPADIPITQYFVTEWAQRVGRGRTSKQQAVNIGIPGLTVELGGGGHPLEAYVQDALTGLRNMAIQLGIIDGGDSDGRCPGHVISTDGGWPRPNRGGIWEQVVDLGDIIEAGDKIGQVRSTATGEVLEEIFAPYKSVILDIRNTAMIMSGEWTVHLGRPVELEGAA